MITNERQYRITRSEAEKFRKSLEAMSGGRPSADVHPLLFEAQKNSLASQLKDLESEISEYEQLKAAERTVISVESFDELAEGLIRARIAAGLSQKALAERVGIKEQQVQRYESERYASASYQRLREITKALGVRIKNDILLPIEPSNLDGILKKVRQVGIEAEFLISRLLPSADAARISGQITDMDEQATSLKIATALSRIFGWTNENIFSAQPLAAPTFAAAEARFKMPPGRNRSTTNLYALYANYLATVVVAGCKDLPKSPIPHNAQGMRTLVTHSYGGLTLRNVLLVAWDLGVPILPLRDKGTFHGACWRYEGRNVIVLKQNSKHQARWLFDLLHELFHASQRPELDTLEVIEADETSKERRNSDEEIEASQYAGDVVLDGRAEQLAQFCVKAAGGQVEKLKGVVPDVARREGIGVGDLANYLAFRLSWQGVNWWGAASNLQTEDADPWTIARDIFVEKFPFHFESDLDRQILERALS